MQAVRAKLFQNGGSQAVRLPRECRFPDGQREVIVRREGDRLILEPVDSWPEDFRSCLGAWSEVIARPRQANIDTAVRRNTPSSALPSSPRIQYPKPASSR